MVPSCFGCFRAGWKLASDADLPSETLQAIEKGIRKAVGDNSRGELAITAYNFLLTHPELNRPTTIKIKGEPEVRESPLHYLIRGLESEVLPFAESYPHVDVIGQFYAEFLRYTGGDGKGLGIVLTPRHLTELFVQIAKVGVNDTVLDPCAGTGGFLIAAMMELDRQVGDDPTVRTRIRERQLIGIEQQPAMYALSVSNMVLRGDGRSNLHRGSCFDPKIQKAIIEPKRAGMQRPTKGLLNPPYSQEGEEQHELDFVKAMMDMLAKGGIGVAVVPMSCAIAPHPARNRLWRRTRSWPPCRCPKRSSIRLDSRLVHLSCALTIRTRSATRRRGSDTGETTVSSKSRIRDEWTTTIAGTTFVRDGWRIFAPARSIREDA